MLALAVWTIEAVLQLASPSDPQIRPDGAAYAYVMRGGIHMAGLPSAQPPQRIGSGTRPRWSPDSKLLAFLDKQIKVYDPADRSIRSVTDAKAAITSFAWSADGAAIAYLSIDSAAEPDPIVADQDYRYSRLYWQPLSGGSAKLITKQDRHVISFSVSPDSTHAVYAAQPTPRNRDAFNVDLFEIDLRSGLEKLLVAQPGRDADPSYSPDGRSVAFHSQAGSNSYFEARHVAVVPSTGGAIRYITAGLDWDVFRNGAPFIWASDSSSVIYTAGKGAQDVLLRHELATNKVEVLTERIAGSASCTSSKVRCVFLKASPERPPEVFLLDEGSERQLTDLQRGVAELPRIQSEVVRWRASDGLALEGILWLPVGYRPGTRVPLLTDLHGGPTGVTLHSFPLLERLQTLP